MHLSELTRACATKAEAWAARNARTVVVGIGCFNDDNPAGELMSWGVCGSIVPALRRGDAVEGTCVVDINGQPLWRRDDTAKPTGLHEVNVYCPDRVIDDPEERKWLHDTTGAHILSMECAKLARTGRLRRIVRVVSDHPGSSLSLAASFARRNGSTDMAMLGWSMKIDPVGTSSQLVKLSKAIYSLSRVSFQ